MECWKYNPDVDYVAAINRYNELVNSGKNDEAIMIARQFGGLDTALCQCLKAKGNQSQNREIK